LEKEQPATYRFSPSMKSRVCASVPRGLRCHNPWTLRWNIWGYQVFKYHAKDWLLWGSHGSCFWYHYQHDNRHTCFGLQIQSNVFFIWGVKSADFLASSRNFTNIILEGAGKLSRGNFDGEMLSTDLLENLHIQWDYQYMVFRNNLSVYPSRWGVVGPDLSWEVRVDSSILHLRWTLPTSEGLIKPFLSTESMWTIRQYILWRYHFTSLFYYQLVPTHTLPLIPLQWDRKFLKTCLPSPDMTERTCNALISERALQLYKPT
jgi:hypothetical protein